MKSIDSALNAKFDSIKVNCVLIKGFNDNEILDFVELTRNKSLDVRFIEYMPFDGNKWKSEKLISFKEMLTTIRDKYPDLEQLEPKFNETSKAYKVKSFCGQIGFITSMTDNFCGTCNRIRITADGNLKVCLNSMLFLFLNICKSLLRSVCLAKKRSHCETLFVRERTTNIWRN